MELFSESFEGLVRQIFEKEDCTVIATIPLNKGRPIPIVDFLKKRSDCTSFFVTKDNRDSIEDEIFSLVMPAL